MGKDGSAVPRASPHRLCPLHRAYSCRDGHLRRSLLFFYKRFKLGPVLAILRRPRVMDSHRFFIYKGMKQPKVISMEIQHTIPRAQPLTWRGGEGEDAVIWSQEFKAQRKEANGHIVIASPSPQQKAKPTWDQTLRLSVCVCVTTYWQAATSTTTLLLRQQSSQAQQCRDAATRQGATTGCP